MTQAKALSRMAAVLLAFLVATAMLALTCGQALAKANEVVKKDGFEITVYYDGGETPNSVLITGYTGSATELKLPTAIKYNGMTLQIEGVNDNAFKGNTALTKVYVPSNASYVIIGSEAFANCTNLKEVAIGDTVQYLSSDAFSGCSGVTAYVVTGSEADTELSNISGFTIKRSTTPPASTEYTRVLDIGGSSGGSSSDPEKQMGEDGTPIGKGASAAAATKYLTSFAKESDPKGSVFNGLQLKMKKVTKKSVKISWKKVSGAKKYAIYGNKCGKKNKLDFICNTTKTSYTAKKVHGKKVKKGTYYKFIVVALNKNNKVITTSKVVHAATSGGKVGNDKKVTTKAKKNKVTIKKGKKFKLGAKPVPASKKLKVKRHRGLNYESTNPKIAKVTSKGVITGKKKGTCYVYAYAQDGVCAKVKVTVK